MRDALAAMSSAGAPVDPPAAASTEPVRSKSSTVVESSNSGISSNRSTWDAGEAYGPTASDGLAAVLGDLKDIAEFVELSTEEVADLLRPAAAAGSASESLSKDRPGQSELEASGSPGSMQAQQLQQQLEAALQAMLSACQLGPTTTGKPEEGGLTGSSAKKNDRSQRAIPSVDDSVLCEVLQAWAAAMATAQDILRRTVDRGG
jgi:hypothetical protein